MNFFVIAWRNITERTLASFLTGLSMALGVAAVVCVIVIHGIAVAQFEQDAGGYNFIVGGGGGRLQLVMSTVYHLDQGPYPVDYQHYRSLVDGKYAGYVDVAVPYCLGDSYAHGKNKFRVVGTTPALFDKLEYRNGKPYQFAAGRNFKRENFFEAVIGSIAARQTGLKVGDLFNATHGLSDDPDAVHEESAFKVVGILEPTGTANDRAMFINMEGFYLLEGHADQPPEPPSSANTNWLGRVASLLEDLSKAEAKEPVTADPQIPLVGYDNEGNPIEPLPENQRKVTSILVRCKHVAYAQLISDIINKKEVGLQAVAPAAVITNMLDKIVAPARTILLVMTLLIVAVAVIGIMVSIYNTMAQRSYDIGVMRALGASRMAVQSIILIEAVLLTLLGGAAGWVLGHLLVGVSAPWVEKYSGVQISMWSFSPLELWILPGLVAAALFGGLLPAFTAYNTDVAKALSGAR
jgi:putative ABC transport system permease protein